MAVIESISIGLISVTYGAAACSTISQASGTRRAFSDLAGAEDAPWLVVDPAGAECAIVALGIVGCHDSKSFGEYSYSSQAWQRGSIITVIIQEILTRPD